MDNAKLIDWLNLALQNPPTPEKQPQRQSWDLDMYANSLLKKQAEGTETPTDPDTVSNVMDYMDAKTAVEPNMSVPDTSWHGGSTQDPNFQILGEEVAPGINNLKFVPSQNEHLDMWLQKHGVRDV